MGVGMAAEESNKVKLEKSQKLWLAMKKSSAGNYSYQVLNSYMMGDRTVTTVIVRNNIVTERFMKHVSAEGEEKELYREKGGDVGKDKRGGAALTMDQMHAAAKARLGEKVPEFHKLYYRFGKDGVLTACYSVDTRIMDDVSINGFSIANLKLVVNSQK